MMGIYKITSPSNKIYIGQSVNIKKRWVHYNGLNCKEQRRLYSSFIKYGVKNHKFEVVIECSFEELNELERYYQELYSCLGVNGLNCSLVKTKDKKFQHSDESKKRLSIAHTGKKMSEEARLKMSLSGKGRIHSIEARLSKSKAFKNRVFSDSHKKAISKSKIGHPVSDETRKKLSLNNKIAKIVINLETGIFYNSVKEAASSTNICFLSLQRRLRGETINNTSFKHA